MRPTEVLLSLKYFNYIIRRLQRYTYYKQILKAFMLHRKKYNSLNKALLDIYKAAFEDLIQHLFHLYNGRTGFRVGFT